MALEPKRDRRLVRLGLRLTNFNRVEAEGRFFADVWIAPSHDFPLNATFQLVGIVGSIPVVNVSAFLPGGGPPFRILTAQCQGVESWEVWARSPAEFSVNLFPVTLVAYGGLQ